jgi:hypothetical protein
MHLHWSARGDRRKPIETATLQRIRFPVQVICVLRQQGFVSIAQLRLRQPVRTAGKGFSRASSSLWTGRST